MNAYKLILIAVLLCLANAAVAQEHFQIVAITDENMSLLATECNIEGVLLTDGDELAAFDPQGVCAGVGLFEFDEDGLTGLALWVDDDETDRDEGFEPGDAIACRFWDARHEIEVPAEMEIREGPDRWEANSLIIARLTAGGVPRFRVGEREHDFGLLDMAVAEPALWATTITNTGNGLLQLGQLTGQGDAAYFGTELEDQEILPDSSITLSVSFPQGDYQPGHRYEAVLSVSTNADDAIVFDLTGEIGAASFHANRDSIDMGEACPGDDGYGTPQQTFDSLLVINQGNATLLISEIIFPDSAFFLAPEFPDTGRLAPGEQTWLPLVFDPWDPENLDLPYAGWIIFRTNAIEEESLQRVWIQGRGVWYFEVEPVLPAPATFNLEPPFPNPFNSSTSIRFELPEASILEIEIFDISGRLVKGVSLERAAGYYTWSWNGTNTHGSPVTSGSYICNIEYTPGRGNNSSTTTSFTIIR